MGTTVEKKVKPAKIKDVVKKNKKIKTYVSPENMERIEKIGKFGESFDDVLGRLLDYWEKADED